MDLLTDNYRNSNWCIAQNSRGPTPLKYKISRYSHLLNYMYKRSDNPEYLDLRNLPTRRHDGILFTVINPKKEMIKRSVMYKGSLAWNNLEEKYKRVDSYTTFKYKQKHWLKQL